MSMIPDSIAQKTSLTNESDTFVPSVRLITSDFLFSASILVCLCVHEKMKFYNDNIAH